MISDYDARKIAKYVCNMLQDDILPQIASVNDEVMDTNAAAAFLGISPKTLRNKGPKVPRVKKDGRWYYSKVTLNRWKLKMD